MYEATERCCANCGLAVRLEGGFQCYVSKRVYTAQEATRRWECPYYSQPVREGGELLSQHQLLLLKQNEIDRKK